MDTINITNARQNLYKLVADVNIGYNPITIVNNKGENAVLISEEEWKNIEETLFLSSIPGFVREVNNIRDTEDWENVSQNTEKTEIKSRNKIARNAYKPEIT